MNKLIGTSVGDWNTSKKVYPNPQFSNLAGTINYSLLNNASLKYFDPLNICGKFIVPPSVCGMSGEEFKSRSEANNTLKDYGLSKEEIQQAWVDYQSEVQSEFDKTKFINFAKSRVQSQGTADVVVNDKIVNDYSESGIDKKPTPTNNPTSNETTSKSNRNYFVYGGIGLVVIVGAYLIFIKK